MQADSLARRVIMRIDPDYADRRINELFTAWWVDIATRPDVYEQAIDTAPLKFQHLLRGVLPHIQEWILAETDDERAAIDAKYEHIITQCQAEPEIWVRPWLDLYFVPDSDLDDELTRCCQVLQMAGRLTG